MIEEFHFTKDQFEDIWRLRCRLIFGSQRSIEKKLADLELLQRRIHELRAVLEKLGTLESFL